MGRRKPATQYIIRCMLVMDALSALPSPMIHVEEEDMIDRCIVAQPIKSLVIVADVL